MTTIILTTTAVAIKAVFSDQNIGDCVECYKKLSSIISVSLHTGRKGDYVKIHFSDGANWFLDTRETRGGKVATIDATAVTDNDDLVAKLAALMT